MERLTDCAQGYCELYCESYGWCQMDPEICERKNEAALYAKLKEYEATGLEPGSLDEMQNEVFDLGYQSCLNYRGLSWMEAEELQRYRENGTVDRLRELVEAEKDGRLVVLPCKVGDMVYAVRFASHEEDENGDITPRSDGGKMVIWPVRISMISHNNYLTRGIISYAIGSTENGAGVTFESSDFGKTVFLTREEAERVLAKDNNVRATDTNVGNIEGGEPRDN